MELINRFDEFGTIQTTTIADIPLDMDRMNWTGMVHDECKIIPYYSDELKQAVECLATDVGNEHGWIYVDYAKTKTALMVNVEQSKVDLLIEVFPELVPQNERAELMQWHLSEAVKGTAEYEDMQGAVLSFYDRVDTFYSGAKQDGELAIVDIKLTDSECNALLWGLARELE